MNEVFEQLKSIMLPAAESLNITKNDPGHINVYTFHEMKKGSCLWFGGVRIQKNYVSYYLMPVYSNPKLLINISSELKKRMQGKSCFNFKTIDKALLDELASLTASGLEDYVSNGFVKP